MARKKSKPEDLRISVGKIKITGDDERDIVVKLRLNNEGQRAIHYIADLRARHYDSSTKQLTLLLSDEGRALIPGAAAMLPKFRVVDPSAEAEIEIRIPDRIIRLSRTVPPGELAFETQDLHELETIVVEIAWSDIPYYEDTRKKDPEDARLPAARWQQHKAKAVKQLKTGSGSAK